MVAVAERFSDKEGKAEYRKALKRFRLPYWDPVLPRKDTNKTLRVELERVRSVFGMPQILSVPHVWVVKPGKGKVAISNPLHHYNFPSSDQYKRAGREIPWKDDEVANLPRRGRERTLRTPDAAGESNDLYLNRKIRAQAQSMAIGLWLLLSPDTGDLYNPQRPWEVFATHAAFDEVSEAVKEKRNKQVLRSNTGLSLESWHDNVHVLVGASDEPGVSGHMTIIAVASVYHFNYASWLLGGFC